MINFKISKLNLLAAVSILLILSGLVLTPSAILLSQCFPKVNLEPSCIVDATKWTETLNVSQGSMYIKPIYLEYGEAINCFYFSAVPVNFYLFDLNSFSRYATNPVSQAIMQMKISYSGFVRFTPSIPGLCCIFIINPVRFYPVIGEITIYKYSTIPILTSNNEYNCCLHISIFGAIILGLGIAMYIIVSKYKKKELKNISK